tara:strand:+ start:1008 stop:1142 length:135 start_codon:yes stop_codon:yes gene_type:complete
LRPGFYIVISLLNIVKYDLTLFAALERTLMSMVEFNAESFNEEK